MLKRILYIVFIVFISISGYGQNYKSMGGAGRKPSVNYDNYTSKSKKAVDYYLEAKRLFNTGLYKEALVRTEKSLDKDPRFVEAVLLTAYIFMDSSNVDQAIAYFEKSLEIDPDFFPSTYFTLATLEIGQSKYNDALNHLNIYLEKERSDRATRGLAQNQVKNCYFAMEAMKHPVDYNPINMGPNVNSPMDEYYPTITVDNKFFIYTRALIDDRSIYGYQEDFYVSEKQGGMWQKSFNMGPPINSVRNEGAATISADGKLMFFVGCANETGYGRDRQGLGSCDLFYVLKDGDVWTRPANLGKPVNSGAWESQPSFSSDGRTLYFVSNRRGGKGRKDIWVTRVNDAGVWSPPENLGDNINTRGSEETVFIHPDNQTLYFSSDGHVGMGGLDIYMSKKQEDGSWGEPINLGYPINTGKNENSLLVDAQGRVAYFGSDREGGEGGRDLYAFELPEQYRPELVTYMKGKVFDKKSGKKLRAKFELIDLESGKYVVESYSDPTNGEFLVSIPANRDYALNVSKSGYMFFSENFALKENSENEPFIMDVPLQPIEVGGPPVTLKNVFFETASYELKDESKVELKKLIDFLNVNPGISIEVSGHTDNVGAKEYNKELSTNRSKSVWTYLIENGVAEARITYKGFGDERPKYPNDSDEHRALNRRTEFTIVGK